MRMVKEIVGRAVVEYDDDLEYYCVPAFFINGKRGDLYHFGRMQFSTRGDAYGSVICSSHFEPDEKMSDETRKMYGINEEEFKEMCDLLGEISGFSNCSDCY